MKTINENIKNQEFSHVYLMYGEEDYLKKQFRDRLKTAIIGDDTMNYSYFEGEHCVPGEIISIGNTMPFFAERRLIIVENSDFFKTTQDEMADFIKNLPDYLYMVFVEAEIDKRNKVYKAVTATGYATEMAETDERTLYMWIASIAKQAGKNIQRDACVTLVDRLGTSMELIRNELDKLFAYVGEADVITNDDVLAISSEVALSVIFDLITAIAEKNKKKALDLYYDMILQREPPMRILVLLNRQFNGILLASNGAANRMKNGDIAKAIGVAPFVVGKYLSQAKAFSTDSLKWIVRMLVQTETDIKTGWMDAQLAVELAIVQAIDS